MRKAIIISDSFKGTLSSQEICRIARESFAKLQPDCRLLTIPVADGGEGTVACFHEACGGELVTVPVQGPYGETVEASYLQLPDHRAVIEMASSSGLPQVGDRKDPCRTSTFGVGQQIRHAIEAGNRQILVGLGGSCTNDGGCGCAAALGVEFLDAEGKPFVPVGGTLDRIAAIRLREAEKLLRDVKITAMCDIDNPLYGPTGAAYVFGPQKGADAATVEFLDGQLRAFDAMLRRVLGRCVAEVPGAGAAGGFGAGMLAFFRAELQPGIEAVLDMVGFDRLLRGCDLVITGEGQLDSQSIRGKVISGVGRRSYWRGVPVVVIAGSVLPEMENITEQEELGVRAVFSVNRRAMDFSRSRHFSQENYRSTLENILRLITAAEHMRSAR